jgi:hypothetical protein
VTERKLKRLEVFFELLIFGIILGITEDLLAVVLVTGEPVTWRVLGLVTVIAIPFAIIGEVFVDQIDLLPLLHRLGFGRQPEGHKDKHSH